MNNCQIYVDVQFSDKTLTDNALISWTWDFGDGGTSTSQNPVHSFLAPGYYNVSLTACNLIGCDVYNTQIYVDNRVRGQMYICDVPPPAEVTQRNRYPFTICLSSPLSGDNFIHLYSQYSRSAPYEATQESKWQHLLPTWHFEDTNGNITDTIVAETSTVYSSGCPVGSIGTAQFYYIDDMPTFENTPVLLWATLELSGMSTDLFDNQPLPGYANSKVIAGTPYVINGQNPHHLEITRNGIADINKLKWTDNTFPYVITINGEFSGCGAGRFPVIFDYPSANNVGFDYPIHRTINNISASALTWTADPDYFKRYDTQGLFVGGFERGTVMSTQSSLNTFLSANVGVKFLNVYRETPYVWVSNPENRTINRVSFPITISQTIIDMLTGVPLGIPVSGITDSRYSTPYITEIDPTNMFSFSGYGGIFGIAQDPCYDIWTTDAEMDYIYKFDIRGNLVSSICLTDATQISGLSAGCTPAGISLTHDLNLWITLFDSISVLRFNENGEYMYSVYPSTALDITDNTAFMPTMAAPDSEENLWVSYANTNSSALIKYLPTAVSASEILRVSLPTSSTPVDIMVDGIDDSIWVANANAHISNYGNIQHYSSTGVLLTSINLEKPSFITLDRWGGTWATYGYNNVAYIPSGMSPILFSVTGDNISTDLNFDQYNDTAMGGIGADSRGSVWIISSTENKVYRVSATNDFDALTGSLLTFDVYPNSITNNWALVNGNYVEYNDPMHHSAQAYGDWTGYRWIRTYMTESIDPNTPIFRTISGVSNVFNLKEFENQNIIRRYNESWDAAEQIRDYALSDHVNAYYNLFEGYIKGMVGGNENEDQHIGRLSYEKIANFVKNNNNIDTSNFKQVYSISNQYDVPIDNYDFSYPIDLRRMMDIASISHNNLWGARCKCDKNFDNNTQCKVCGHYHCSNIGTQFYTATAILSAGVRFVAKPVVGPTTNDIIEPVVSGPLSALQSISWLTSAEFGNYNFYWHVPTYCNSQVEGVINWGDNYTTLSELNSSLSAWYGEWGLLEEMFDYQLHRGLNLNG